VERTYSISAISAAAYTNVADRNIDLVWRIISALRFAARGPHSTSSLRSVAQGRLIGREEDFFVGFFPALSLQRALRASDTYQAIFIRPAAAGLDCDKSNKFHPTFRHQPAARWHSLIKDS
jgi:hypothetical protein